MNVYFISIGIERWPWDLVTYTASTPCLTALAFHPDHPSRRLTSLSLSSVPNMALPATSTPMFSGSLDVDTNKQFREVWMEAWEKFQEQTKADKSRSKLVEALRVDLEGSQTEEDVINVLRKRAEDVESKVSKGSNWVKFRDACLRPAVQVVLLFNDAIAEVANFFVSHIAHSSRKRL